MREVIIPEDAIGTMLWDIEGNDMDVCHEGIHDALFANLMGWA